ncbi:hypothetical protein [Streptomyces sp. NPDC052496]|uniref:hypothetical protein n=1 Tax=Streptomyces sp. NPDC052496 TaxID=3154951 RepID=UPI00341F0C04
MPWTHFALSYGSLAASVLAVGVYLVLRRGARRRGDELGTGPQGRFAVLGVVAGLMIALSGTATVMTHADAAEAAAGIGRPVCEG